MKRGIALGGGGARGAYQAGAIKALKEHGYLDDFDAVSGVSVGSLNASLLSMHDFDAIDALWLSNKGAELFDKPEHILKTMVTENVKLYDKGIYETKRLEDLIDEIVNYEQLRNHPLYVGIAYVGEEDTGFFDLVRANIQYRFDKEHYMRYVSLNDYDNATIKKTLLASCAIPMVFKPVKINGKTYLDGGIFEKLPIQPLVDAGCDEVIAIDLFRFHFRRKTKEGATTIRHIYPSRNLRGVMDFKESLNTMRYETGYEDAKKAIQSWENETNKIESSGV